MFAPLTVVAAIALASPDPAGALCVLEPSPSGRVWVTTPHLELLVQEGVIAQVKNRITGELHAQATDSGSIAMPRGLGHLTGDARGAAYLHSQWNTYPLYSEAPFFHHPQPQSRPYVQSSDTSCSITWTVLTNGTTPFPQESLVLELLLAPGGGVRFRTTVQSSDLGVFGALIPNVNLHAGHRVYVPSFGGVVYDQKMSPGVRTLDRAPYLEAPVVALETTNALASTSTMKTPRPRAATGATARREATGCRALRARSSCSARCCPRSASPWPPSPAPTPSRSRRAGPCASTRWRATRRFALGS